MKHKFSFLMTFWWCLLLGVLGLLPFITGNRAGGVSELENRTLAPLPVCSANSWFDGSFAASLEAYLSDQLPGRSGMLDCSSGLIGVFSVLSEEERLLQTDIAEQIDRMGEAGAASEPRVDGSETPDDDEDMPERTGDTPGAAESGTPGGEPAADGSETPDDGSGIFDGNGADTPGSAGGEAGAATPVLAYRLTDGGTSTIFQFGAEAISATVCSLNAYRAALPADGTVTFIYVPYSQAANTWLFHPARYAGWYSTVEPALQAAAADGVYICPAVGILGAHMEQGEAVYFKTDHHWSPLGASYVQQDVMAQRGTPSADYADFTYTVHDRFTGSITQSVRASAGSSVVDRLEVPAGLQPTRAFVYRDLDVLMKEVRYMEPERSSYGALLGGTHSPFYVAETGFHTGRNALIICDSYGNAFLPYLTPYYDRVCMADLRDSSSFGSMGGASVREYIEHYAIDDVYFVVSTGCGVNSGYMRHTVYEYLG